MKYVAIIEERYDIYYVNIYENGKQREYGKKIKKTIIDDWVKEGVCKIIPYKKKIRLFEKIDTLGLAYRERVQEYLQYKESAVYFFPEDVKKQKRFIEIMKKWNCGDGGYIGGRWSWGMSNSAKHAHLNGLKTKSQLPKILRELVEEGLVRPREWHHTGYYRGHMNITYFYHKNDFLV